MSVNIDEIRKMEKIKNKILSDKIITPTTCVMEFFDKTRTIISIDSRLMMAKGVYETANYIIQDRTLEKLYKEEQNEIPSKNKRL